MEREGRLLQDQVLVLEEFFEVARGYALPRQAEPGDLVSRFSRFGERLRGLVPWIVKLTAGKVVATGGKTRCAIERVKSNVHEYDFSLIPHGILAMDQGWTDEKNSTTVETVYSMRC